MKRVYQVIISLMFGMLAACGGGGGFACYRATDCHCKSKSGSECSRLEQFKRYRNLHLHRRGESNYVVYCSYHG